MFVPDYRVSLAEQIIPGADLSEQISTAGTEASGTGNMKLAMNGALTIGTLDGANIEILDEVGAENIFIFGLTADEIQTLRASGSYRPRDLYAQRPSREADLRCVRLQPVLSERAGAVSLDRRVHPRPRRPLFPSSPICRRTSTRSTGSTEAFSQPAAWASKAILNVARIGRFSSDRTVAEYARDIWRIAGSRLSDGHENVQSHLEDVLQSL